jgi:hypothetical protein
MLGTVLLNLIQQTQSALLPASTSLGTSTKTPCEPVWRQGGKVFCPTPAVLPDRHPKKLN